MFDDDVQYIDAVCPKCGNDELRGRQCTAFCEYGYIDDSDDDPINFIPGESVRKCRECRGTGWVTWCPKCGADLSGIKLQYLHDDDDYPDQ